RSILALAFDAGARRLAAAGEEGRVWILDVSSGRDRELDSLGAGSLSVAWTPDERELAVSGFDGVVRVIDVETGRLLRTLGEPGTAHLVAVSPDGRTLATGGRRSRSDPIVWGTGYVQALGRGGVRLDRKSTRLNSSH